MRFDWYASTVPANPQVVLGTLVQEAELADLRPARPMHGYTHGAEIVRGSRVLARALYGGPNGPDTHVWASGEDTEWLVGRVRHHWPQHRVTRVDAAEDFTAQGAWRTLSKIALQVADAFRIRVIHQGDFHRGEGGRSIYLGSRDSPTQLIVYEKGKQLGHDPNWVRVEARVKPRKLGKDRMCTALPSEVWGCAAYLQEMGERMLRVDLERIQVGTLYRVPDDARAWAALTRQYGNLLGGKADELGGWAALGPFLETLIVAKRSTH